MIRKISFLFCVVLIASVNAGMAQSNKVVSAWNYLNDFIQYKDAASLTKAKDAIDLATVHENTKGEAKTWSYRGKIYQAIFENNLRVATEKLTDISDLNKKTLTAYQNISSVELEQAYEAYVKTNELDVKKVYKSEITNKQNECARHFENKGIANYNAKNYAAALPMFEKALEVNTLMGRADTNNTNNSAIVAERSGNYEKAKTYYQKLVDMKYGKGTTYSSLAAVYMTLKDTVGAIEIIKKGREMYPGDVGLLITETNFALKNGQNEKAIENLKLAIQKVPTDPNLYLVLGNVYDNLANPKDAAGKDKDKPANYEDLLKNAEQNYKKAIELKPDYFDALYNLGVLYNNHGVSLAKKADSIVDQAKYAKANADANEEFKKAIPVLEKALEISATDRNTMNALKQLYSRTEQADKLKQINERLKN